MIAVVDYGVGNLGSIINMFKRIGQVAVRASDRETLAAAERILLPGVGSYDVALERLEKLDLIGPLSERVLEKKTPVLGICLGMQIMGNSSEEGEQKGLSWIDGKAIKFAFPSAENVKIPHMGWSYVSPSKTHHLTKYMGEDNRYYFVHSYHFVCSNPDNELMSAHFGGMQFTPAIVQGNIAAVQFHPEKSHRYGLELMKQFSNWNPHDNSKPPS